MKLGAEAYLDWANLNRIVSINITSNFSELNASFVVIPAYNEEATIETLLKRVSAQKFADVEMEVIVVDDGSVDETRNILNENDDLYDRLILRSSNGGKGALFGTD